MTRTLGIKFEVVGFKKAADSINQQQKAVDKSVKANTENLELIKNIDKEISATTKKSQNNNISLSVQTKEFDGDYVGNTITTYRYIQAKEYQKAFTNFAVPRANAVQGGIFEGIGNQLGARIFNKVDGLFRNFLGIEEYTETVDLSQRTVDKIGVSVARALTGRSPKSSPQRDKNTGKLPKAILQRETIIDNAINQALMPIRTIQYSFFEGIGSYFGNQFATGLGKVFDEDLDFSAERRGKVVGKGISYFATEGKDKITQDIKELATQLGKLKKNQGLKEFNVFLKQLINTIADVPTQYQTGYKRGAVEIEGLRKVQQEIDAIDDKDLPDLTGKEKAVFSVGGFAADEGRSGFKQAEIIKAFADEKTEVLGASNKATDLSFSVFGNKALWAGNVLSKVAELNLKGYNEDAVKLAAQIILLLRKNPNLKATVAGHSAGGFVAEEVQQILDLLGYGERIETIASGTPRTKGSLENPNTRQVVGDGDTIVKGAESFGEAIGLTKQRNQEDELKGVSSHFAGDYLISEDYLRAVLGDNFREDKARKPRQELKGKLIELENLYFKYLTNLAKGIEEVIEDIDPRPDRLVAKTRRYKLRKQTHQLIYKEILNPELEKLNVREGTENAVLVIGGFGAAKGKSGKSFAAKMGQIAKDKKTQFLGIDNEFSDIFTPEDLANENKELLIPKILEMFAEVHKLGYNPDAVKAAAQVLDMQAKNPNLNIKITGFSGGGYIAEDVIELLKTYGANMERIEAVGFGTPELPGGIKNPEYKKLLGEQDPIMNANKLKDFNNKIKQILGFDVFPDLMKSEQNIKGIKSHELNEYLIKSQELQKLVYGNDPKIKQVLSLFEEIQNKYEQVDNINSQIQDLATDESLDSSSKATALIELRETYIDLLLSIAETAKTAKKIGGGRYFKKQHDFARKELEESGIEIEPFKKTARKPNNSTENIQSETQKIVHQYKKEYRQYLQNIIKSENFDFQETTQAVIKDLENLTTEGQQSYIEQMRSTFNVSAKNYRQALKNGELEIAAEQGEKLLKLATLLKALYEQLEDSEIDPQVKSKLIGLRRYLTSVQNEVIEGSNAKGRSPEGLPVIFDREIDASALGANFAEGFVEGILDSLAEAESAGEQIIEAAEEGVRKRGEIKSPSELAKRLGRWFAKGFGLGVESEDFQKIGEGTVNEIEKGILTAGKSSNTTAIEKHTKQYKEELLNSLSFLDFFKKSLKRKIEDIKQESKILFHNKKDTATSFGEELEERGREEIDKAYQGAKNKSRRGLVKSARVLYEKSKQAANFAAQDRPEARAKAEQLRQEISTEIDKLKSELGDEFSEEIAELEDYLTNNARKDFISVIKRIYDKSKDLYKQGSNNPELRATGEKVADKIKQEAQEVTEEIKEQFAEEIQEVEKFIRKNQNSVKEFVENKADSPDKIASLFDLGGESLIKQFGKLIFGASQNEDFDRLLDTAGELLGKLFRIVATVKILKTVLDALGLEKFIGAFTNLREEATEVAKVAEVLNERILDFSESSEQGAKNLKFITDEANRLNTDLNAAKDNYSQLLAATQENPLAGVQTEQIYTAFAATARKKGFTEADEQGLFRSVRSVIGKDRLSSEEVFQEIGERLPEFPRLIAQAQGVSIPELRKMMSNGQVRAGDVLPKVSAALIAQNGLSSGAETLQAKENRLDGQINSFREAVGQMFLPIQKFGYDRLNDFFGWLTDKVDYVSKIISGGITTLLIYLVTWKTFGQAAQKAILGLIKVIWSFRLAIGKFLLELLLVQIAIETWVNVFKIGRNQFPEAQKDIENLTKGIEAFTDAVNEASIAGEKLNNNLPKQGEQLKLAEGWKLPDNAFGNFIRAGIGQDYLNLDFMRRGLDTMTGGRAVTQAEKKEADFLVASSDFQTKSNKILTNNYKAAQAADKIAEYDQEILAIQSERLRLLPGDTEGLKASLEAERAIQKERDKQLKILTQQQQNLQLVVDGTKARLEELEGLRSAGGITQANYDREKNSLNLVLEDAEDGLQNLADILGKVPKELSAFNRELTRAKDRVSGFMENRDRISTQERTDIISQGIANGEGEQTIQLKLDRANVDDIEARIEVLNREIAGITQNLDSTVFTEAQKRVEEAAVKSGGLSTDVINRLLEQERDPQEKEALQGALTIRELQTQLFQYQEQLAQSAQQSRNSLIDLNRSIEDYFFNLIQRIKEARLETENLISQLFATNIRNQLRAAIAPGSDSFVRGIIDSIGGIFDQAQSLVEQSLGIKSGELQLEAESRSLEIEMQDFIRGLSGATEALSKFRTVITSPWGDPKGRDLDSVGLPSSSGVGSSSGSSRDRSNFFPIPGLNIKNAPISSGYGWRNIFGRKDFHEGIDVAVKGGTDVVAVNNGIVSRIKPLADQMQVAVESVNASGQKVTEWFIHLGKNLNVAVGDRISAGQKIGEVAATTNTARRAKVSTGDHLDYRVMVGDKWVNPKEFLSSAKQQGVQTVTVNVDSETSQFNQELIGTKQQNLGIQQIIAEVFGRKELERAVADAREQQDRTFKIEGIQFENQLADVLDRLADLQDSSQLPTAEVEMNQQLRGISSQYRGLKLEGVQGIQRFADTVADLQGIITVFPDLIAKIEQSGNSEWLASLPLLRDVLENAEAQLPKATQGLESAKIAYQNIAKEEEKAIAFTRRQSELKIQQEELSKRSQVNQLKLNIATERGTSELRRQLAITQEKLRLDTRINEIKSTEPDQAQADKLIQLERQQSRVNIENINRDAFDRDTAYEQQLLDLNSGIASGKSGLLSGFGFEFESNRIQRENAIAQENFRYQNQLVELERTYGAEPDKLALLKQRAEELNQVNLQGIQQQFKTLGGVIRNNAQQALSDFFYDWFSEIGKGKDLFLGFLRTILDGIKRIAAQKLASAILGSIFGGISGGIGSSGSTTSLNFGGASAFTAKEGITVPNYLKGGLVQKAANFKNSPAFANAQSAFDNTKGNFFKKAFAGIEAIKASKKRIFPAASANYMRQISPSVDSAFKREGSGGVLGVFTPGEEILSIKTGEAGRYQSLKRRFGKDPLDRLFKGNFANGGTIDIEQNLLSSLAVPEPSINIRAIGEPQKQQHSTQNITNFSATVVTPDADSFRASEYQMQQDIAEALLRSQS